ncbi:MAG: oligosaccharide repeat unit polymerase [Muricauda sp. TMED12]|nr:MAG: oligosaccharide repeat unit polymerase [Muricauda sp. TMED12]
MIIITAICITCIAAHYHYRSPGQFSPGILHGCVWLSASVVYLYFSDNLLEPKPLALAIISSGIICFSLGCGLGSMLVPPVSAGGETTRLRAIWLVMYTMIAAAGFFALWTRANAIVNIEQSQNWLLDIRKIISSQGSIGFGYAAYIANFGLAATFLALLRCHGRLGWSLAGISFAFSLASMILLTGRTFILLLFVLVGTALFSRRYGKGREVLWTYLVPCLCVAIISLVATTVWQSRFGMANPSLLAGIQEHLLHYIPSPTAAFSLQVQSNESLAYGQHTFRTIYAVLHKLGFDVEVVSLVRPYVLVPISTNVYTVFSPYYADIGWFGVATASLVFGIITGVVNQLGPSQSRPLISILFAILIYALILQFFQDQYMSLLSQWIQLLLATAILSLPRADTP